MTQSLITADSISVIRQRRSVLDNVSLSIGEHDFLTVVGPNGAGKSMLLKCLMGFYKPDQGTVRRRENLRMAYVPQEVTVSATMPLSVRRFLTLRMAKAHRKDLNRVADETGISAFLDKPLLILSGGERQRVLMARALMNNPQLLVLDEPAQNLDVSGQLSFYRLVERVYQERQLSILMVSHDLHMVMASTQRVICLFHHVCCTGTPTAVARDPNFVSLFGHDLADMMATYRHSHNHDHVHDPDVSDACDHGAPLL